MKWQCGLTTVPQRAGAEHLERTLRSVEAGGFPKPRLFVDGCDEQTALAYRHAHGLEVTARSPRIGAWGNWWLGMWELWVRDPHADRFAMFQDDLVIVRNLRQYLEACPYPERGYQNPFLFLRNEEHFAREAQGWHRGAFLEDARVDHRNRWQQGCGALLLVFSREALEVIFTSPKTMKKPLAEDPRMATARIDGGVVSAMNEAGWHEWTHNPSLVLHTGTVSTLEKRHPEIVAREPPAVKVWRRNAGTFPGEQFDALELLKK